MMNDERTRGEGPEETHVDSFVFLGGSKFPFVLEASQILLEMRYSRSGEFFHSNVSFFVFRFVNVVDLLFEIKH